LEEKVCHFSQNRCLGIQDFAEFDSDWCSIFYLLKKKRRGVGWEMALGFFPRADIALLTDEIFFKHKKIYMTRI
jgi:hypothetical protein